jgi:hypothetical protein
MLALDGMFSLGVGWLCSGTEEVGVSVGGIKIAFHCGATNERDETSFRHWHLRKLVNSLSGI